jgi:hypothetical protein
MICGECGREFHGGGVTDTRSSGLSGQSFGNSTSMVTLCPVCARGRRTLPRFILIMLCIISAAMAAITYLIK